VVGWRGTEDEVQQSASMRCILWQGGQINHSCSRHWSLLQKSGVAGVDAALSVVVTKLLALCAGAVVDGSPNVGVVTDEVAGCCVERRPSGTLEERYCMGLSWPFSSFLPCGHGWHCDTSCL
jgi:hypothetical protein